MKFRLTILSIISLVSLSACGSNSTNLNPSSEEVSIQSSSKKQDKSSYKDYINKTNTSISKNNGCRTTPDILGPFYLPNAPERKRMITYDSTENYLNISGTVYYNCDKPLANALVEIWHADRGGNYSNSVGDNNNSYNIFRTSLKTDSKGRYSLQTMLPGAYSIGDNKFRPVHLHFKITAKGQKDLVTQLYFKGDQYITNDPWASNPDAKERIIELKKTSSGGENSAIFDIRL